MKINLRKSAAIQSLLTEQISLISFSTSVVIDRFTSVDETLEKAKQALLTAIANHKRLTLALYSIRKVTQKKSAEVGIPDMLAENVSAQMTISSLTTVLIGNTLIPKREEIDARKEDLSKTPSNVYEHRSESFSIGIVSEGLLNECTDNVNNLKKFIRNTKDKLLDLNIKSEIELDEETADTLKKFNII